MEKQPKLAPAHIKRAPVPIHPQKHGRATHLQPLAGQPRRPSATRRRPGRPLPPETWPRAAARRGHPPPWTDSLAATGSCPTPPVKRGPRCCLEVPRATAWRCPPPPPAGAQRCRLDMPRTSAWTCPAQPLFPVRFLLPVLLPMFCSVATPSCPNRTAQLLFLRGAVELRADATAFLHVRASAISLQRWLVLLLHCYVCYHTLAIA
jgi:hypothetical protein